MFFTSDTAKSSRCLKKCACTFDLHGIDFELGVAKDQLKSNAVKILYGNCPVKKFYEYKRKREGEKGTS